MNKLVVEPGSFRDPKGRIYYENDDVYRLVSAAGRTEFEYVRNTGLFEELNEKRYLIKSEIVSKADWFPDAPDDSILLRHEKIPFVSYPYEWSFSFLKAAALLHLDIHLIALEHGVTLSDASAYNVQFCGCNPIFIDVLSFRKLKKGEAWEGHRQFCEQFLNPLLLTSKLGVKPNAWYRGAQEGISTPELNMLVPWYKKMGWNMLTQVVAQSMLQNTSSKNAADALTQIEYPVSSFKKSLQQMRSWISSLVPAGVKQSEWQNYSDEHSYSDDEQRAKSMFIARFSSKLKPEMLWDIGCNSGDYSRIALQNGTNYSVGFDFDHGALEKGYHRVLKEELSFQPLFFDGANPSPSQGWGETERRGMSGRKNASAVIALAFIHHMVIGRNIPLEEVILWLTSLAPQGVIEFIPKSDPMVKELLLLREDIFEDYSEEHFKSILERHSQIHAAETVTESGRRLYWFEKKLD
ncbi:MAG: class I SAM-dependent methyltransferase [Proteobacteria bacterium]|nr:class I SAM-dependent methyltransferase [Pseudomonadota bacterium]